MPEITLEDEIEAVRSALHLRDHWVAMNQPNSTIWLENKKRADALRSALARLEASRWRPIAEALRDGSPIDLWCVHTSIPAMRSASMEWRRGKWVDWLGQPLNPG